MTLQSERRGVNRHSLAINQTQPSQLPSSPITLKNFERFGFASLNLFSQHNLISISQPDTILKAPIIASVIYYCIAIVFLHSL